MQKVIDIPDEVADKLMIQAVKKKPRVSFKKYLEMIVLNSKEVKSEK